MPIALPDFVGGTPDDGEVGAQRHAGHHRQSEALRAVRADRSGGLHRADHQHRRGAALPRLAHDQRAGAGHRPHHAAGRRPAQDRVPAVGRVRRRQQLTGQQYFTDAGQLAPHRAHHLGRDLRAPHRREGLFRHPRRVRRRVRSEGPARQAARHHGPGRRQRALSDARRRSGADAALLADDAGDHLHVLSAAASRGCSCSTSRRGSARSSATSRT